MKRLKSCCLQSAGLVTQSPTQQNGDTGLSVALNQSKYQDQETDFHCVTITENRTECNFMTYY